MIRRCLLLFIAVLVVVGCVGPAADQSASLRLTVFDCGELGYEDISAFGLTNEESATRRLFVPCYLIEHPDGKMIWDAGLDPSIAGEGSSTPAPGSTMIYRRSLIDQLADINIEPADIDLISVSHFHFDHIGAAALFDEATLIIQAAEYAAAFENGVGNPIYMPELYAGLSDNPRRIIDGDHDVFGDGSVVLLSAPGHTMGHQVLFLDLKNTGPIVLSGDLYHFRESRTLRRTPVFNVDAAETLRSMDIVEAFIEEKNATLWIEHDMSLAESIGLAPDFHD